MEIKYFVLNILGRLRQIQFLRKAFGSIYRTFHKDKSVEKVRELSENFKANGLTVLQKFDSMMNENGYKYSLAFGTMLGAVREKGFIKHDADIDVFMWIDDYNPEFLTCIKRYGFKLMHTFSVDGDKYGKEDAIMMDGVQIDIFYIYPALEGRTCPYSCDFVIHPDCLSREHAVHKHGGLLPRRIEVPMSNEIIRTPFESLSLPILKNAEEFLSQRYGSNYMIPDPNWSSGPNPNIIPWTDKVAVFKILE